MPIDSAFDTARMPVTDPLATIRETTIKALTHLASDVRVQNIFEVAFLRCEYTDELEPVEKRQLQDRQECLRLGMSLLDQAVSCGQLPANTDTRMASHLMYAYIGGIMRDWVQAPDTFDLKAAAPQLVDLFLAGLKAEPPRRLAKAA